MKTIIVGIDQTTGIKVAEELFVNNNSAIENLVNYFLQGMGMQLFFIEQREKIKKDIVCINNRSALIERNGIDYIAIRRDENNKPLPNSDEKTLLADENSAKFYIENWLCMSYYKERNRLISEYKNKYGEDKVDKKKELIRIANGNPDNESVLAARRICEKKGINYNLK